MKESKLLNKSSINKYGRALFLYKYVNNQLPGNCDNHFINNHESHNYVIRSWEDIRIPNSRLDIRKHNIRNAGPALWNPCIMEFPSTLRMLRPSNYFNKAWNHIYYLLRCSHIKWPCSTTFKLKNWIDSSVTVQKNIFIECFIWRKYYFFYALLTLSAAIGIHMHEFFQRVVNKPHTVSTSLCLM